MGVQFRLYITSAVSENFTMKIAHLQYIYIYGKATIDFSAKLLANKTPRGSSVLITF